MSIIEQFNSISIMAFRLALTAKHWLRNGKLIYSQRWKTEMCYILPWLLCTFWKYFFTLRFYYQITGQKEMEATSGWLGTVLITKQVVKKSRINYRQSKVWLNNQKYDHHVFGFADHKIYKQSLVIFCSFVSYFVCLGAL